MDDIKKAGEIPGGLEEKEYTDKDNRVAQQVDVVLSKTVLDDKSITIGDFETLVKCIIDFRLLKIVPAHLGRDWISENRGSDPCIGDICGYEVLATYKPEYKTVLTEIKSLEDFMRWHEQLGEQYCMKFLEIMMDHLPNKINPEAPISINVPIHHIEYAAKLIEKTYGDTASVNIEALEAHGYDQEGEGEFDLAGFITKSSRVVEKGHQIKLDDGLSPKGRWTKERIIELCKVQVDMADGGDEIKKAFLIQGVKIDRDYLWDMLSELIDFDGKFYELSDEDKKLILKKIENPKTPKAQELFLLVSELRVINPEIEIIVEGIEFVEMLAALDCILGTDYSCQGYLFEDAGEDTPVSVAAA